MSKILELIPYILQEFVNHIPSFLIGTLLTICIITLYQLLGYSITKNKHGDSYSFTIGFIVFSFFVAVIGIPILVFDLPWKLFFLGMILLWIASIGFITYSIFTNKITINKEKIKQYFKDNWYIYIGALILVFFALCHGKTMWENSNTDDGYYLTRMATLPYLTSLKYVDPSTGLKTNLSISYLVNTFELEGSFYTYLTHLSVTLYARFFLAYLDYVIILQAGKSMFEMIVNKKNKSVQFVLILVFLVVIMNPVWFLSTKETWTVSSSVYLGSALSRASIVYLSLLILLKRKRLDFRSILFTIMVCTVMISKSSISLPVLFLLAISYLLVISNKYLKLLIVILIAVIGIVLPNSISFHQHVLETCLLYVKNPLFIFPLLGGLYFVYINKSYRKFYAIFSLCFCLLLIPEVTDIFEILCQYEFVADRSVYSLTSAFSFITYSYIVHELINLIKNKKYVISSLRIGTIVSLITLLAVKADGTNVFHAGYNYLRNIDLTPKNTILLAEALEDYYQITGETLYLLTYSGITENGYGHFPQQIIRAFAPDVISPVASLRIEDVYKGDDEFNGLSITDVEYLVDFMNDSNDESFDNLKTILNVYPFNCIAGMNFTPEHDKYLSSIGFNKYKDVSSQSADYTYNIYIKGYENEKFEKEN